MYYKLLKKILKNMGTYRFLIRLAAVISSGNVPNVQYSKCPTKSWIFFWSIKIAKPFKYTFDGNWIITQEIGRF